MFTLKSTLLDLLAFHIITLPVVTTNGHYCLTLRKYNHYTLWALVLYCIKFCFFGTLSDGVCVYVQWEHEYVIFNKFFCKIIMDGKNNNIHWSNTFSIFLIYLFIFAMNKRNIYQKLNFQLNEKRCLPFRVAILSISWLAAEYEFISTLCVTAGSSVDGIWPFIRPFREPVDQWL